MKAVLVGFADRLREFAECKKGVIVFDRDCDGVCSAVLFSKIFPGFEVIGRREPNLPEEFLKRLKRKKADVYVFLDMAVDHAWKRVKELSKTGKVVIIDHHIPAKNLNSKNILHINPLFYGDVYMPAAYIVYRIAEKMDKGIREFVWIAAMACIADYAFRDVKDIYRETEKMFPGILGKDKRKGRLSKAVDFVESVIMAKGEKGAKTGFENLMKAKTVNDVFRSEELRKYWEFINREKKRILKEARKSMKIIKEAGLVAVKIRTNLRLASFFATYFSEKYPEMTVAVGRKTKEGWNVSIRNQRGKVNVGRLAAVCSRGMGSGGGHKKAAGAMVSDWEKFKKRLVRALEKGHK